MRFILLTPLLLAYTAAFVEVNVKGYHENIGIPTASRIKASEDTVAQSSYSRIVGGAAAQPNDHPYLACLLIYFKKHPGTSVCGASLVSPARLVTAALCWDDGRLQAQRLLVVLGSPFLFSGGHRIPTSTLVPHPQFNQTTLRNNVAVIYLPYPVKLSRDIQSIALPRYHLTETFNGDWAVTPGFGKTREGRAKVISVEECKAAYGVFVEETNICTDGSGNVGICEGDHGGPLFVTYNGERVLIGISSFFATAGCKRGFPSGFTRVTSFYEFIKLHI